MSQNFSLKKKIISIGVGSTLALSVTPMAFGSPIQNGASSTETVSVPGNSQLNVLPSAQAIENGDVRYRTYVSEMPDSAYFYADNFRRSSSSGNSAAASTYTFFMSREQVRQSKAALDRGTFLCSVLNLPYPFGVLCGGPSDLRNALNQAYYQNKRIKMVYHPYFNYCAYYDYYVVS